MVTCDPTVLLTKALARQLTFLCELLLLLMVKQISHWCVWPGLSWRVQTWLMVLPGGLHHSLTNIIINSTKDGVMEKKQTEQQTFVFWTSGRDLCRWTDDRKTLSFDGADTEPNTSHTCSGCICSTAKFRIATETTNLAHHNHNLKTSELRLCHTERKHSSNYQQALSGV